MPLTILAVTKVLVCSASLICASIVDLKTREVSNWLWIQKSREEVTKTRQKLSGTPKGIKDVLLRTLLCSNFR